MAIKSWEDIGKAFEAMSMMSCVPKNIHKVKSNFIFDENKSVKWNREKVEENNKLYAEEVARLNTEKNKCRDTIYEDIFETIQDEVGHSLSRDKAILLWAFAYEHGHSYGFNEIMIYLNDIMDLVGALLTEDK